MRRALAARNGVTLFELTQRERAGMQKADERFKKERDTNSSLLMNQHHLSHRLRQVFSRA